MGCKKFIVEFENRVKRERAFEIETWCFARAKPILVSLVLDDSFNLAAPYVGEESSEGKSERATEVRNIASGGRDFIYIGFLVTADDYILGRRPEHGEVTGHQPLERSPVTNGHFGLVFRCGFLKNDVFHECVT
jgi:hypothetical protein